MTIEEFSENKPRFDLFGYFSGSTSAWGMFEDRFGRVRRQFSVLIEGTVDGDSLILDEHFEFADGERSRRVWRIERQPDGSYSGQADDVVGNAVGYSSGNALNWRYTMDLEVGNSTLRVKFDDWMFLQKGGVLMNRARVSKFGLVIGSVSLFFVKPTPVAEFSEAASQ